ncbi:hypothetical protein ACIGXM_14145 [Kitasatospora sp. NPDC052896]|uniref:hypothetical protein n=1 Tax=Kitasatospora sp. NPDC052896 TaxID=3364061 RepID=UPI0037CAAD1F
MDLEFSDSAYHRAFRDMVRDVVACSDFPRFCNSLGLVPSSEEVDDREHRDSHKRIDRVQPILDEITATAVLAADTVHALFTGSCEDDDEMDVYVAISRICVTGAIIRLIDQGKLQVL